LVGSAESEVVSLEALGGSGKMFVQFGVGRRICDGEIVGVSAAGIVIQSKEHFTPGTEVEISFSAVHRGDPMVRMRATVVYCLSGLVAVHFTNVRLAKHVGMLKQIRQLLEQARG
jgi:hypothetical protein